MRNDEIGEDRKGRLGKGFYVLRGIRKRRCKKNFLYMMFYCGYYLVFFFFMKVFYYFFKNFRFLDFVIRLFSF